MTRLFLTAAAFALTLPGVASAHSKLLSSTPAANATVAKPTRLTLTFSETFLAPLSGAELVMTGMPGMANHDPMPIKGFKTAVEGKTMTLTFPRALPAGSYDLKWHIVGADQHKMEGGYSFKVK
ncbi:copper homeostasis periplasmic binding protein CopC [Sphingobium sp. HBC34]|uniref:Copper homeostasis periplasmic binding protein CopC n=1 Tax=Sphingobium cyanobacteriorum TaxID=3063954 RepID=A0ABT8ZQE0_9SPHN|nr:copper homeostasis periplasmic binding protein CopC [Sphingobium sp. HBC34]MDO7836758.1 copper homeostasis periplasmic binding protein CopC [Sphingobium sp. HBC34]